MNIHAEILAGTDESIDVGDFMSGGTYLDPSTPTTPFRSVLIVLVLTLVRYSGLQVLCQRRQSIFTVRWRSERE